MPAGIDFSRQSAYKSGRSNSDCDTWEKAKVSKPRPFFKGRMTHRLAAVSAISLVCGIAEADITPGQAEALGNHYWAMQVNFQAGILAACVNTYPDIRADITKGLQSLSPTVTEEKVNEISDQIGQCMNKKFVLTKNQCVNRANQLSSGKFDWDDERLRESDTSLSMLEPCMKRN